MPRLRRIPSAGRPLGVPNTQEKWGAAGHELSVGERGGVCGRYRAGETCYRSNVQRTIEDVLESYSHLILIISD